MFYGATVWDPVLIVAQIVTIQCLFYVGLGLLLWLMLGPYVVRLNMHHFFDWHMMNFSSFPGWMVAAANLVNGVAGATYLVFIVERAKKVLDFAATAYVAHFLGVLLYSGFPLNFEWWVVNGVALTAAAMLGEWLCLQRELREIPIGNLRNRTQQSSSDISKAVSSTAMSERSASTTTMRPGAGPSNV